MIISIDDKISSILPKVKEGVRTFIVKDKGKYVGIVTDRVIYTSQFDPNAKVKNYIVKAPVIKSDTELEKIAELFLHGYRELPYFNGKDFELLKFTDLLKNLLAEKRIPNKKISQLGLNEIVKIDKNESIAEAIALMRRRKIHHLGISENGKLVGILSSADLFPFLIKIKEKTPLVREKIGPDSIKIASIPYLPKIHEIGINKTLTDAANEMIKNEVMTLVCNGKFLHLYDILKEVTKKEKFMVEIAGKEEVREYIEDVKREIDQLVEKVDKLAPVDYAKLTIKTIRESGERKKYILKFLITLGKEKIAVDSSDWDIHKALHYLKEEVEKIVRSKKERTKGKKIGKNWRRLSAKLREGEYFK